MSLPAFPILVVEDISGFFGICRSYAAIFYALENERRFK